MVEDQLELVSKQTAKSPVSLELIAAAIRPEDLVKDCMNCPEEKRPALAAGQVYTTGLCLAHSVDARVKLNAFQAARRKIIEDQNPTPTSTSLI
jgi:hypothetical protein